MLKFFRWLAGLDAQPHKDVGAERQALQRLESSLRVLQRAQRKGEDRACSIDGAADDLQRTVRAALERMTAAERTIHTANEAVDLIQRKN